MIGHESLVVRVAPGTPGSGTVVHWSSGVLVIGGDPTAALRVLHAGVDVTEAPSPPAPGALLERLRELPVGTDLAAVVPTPGGFRLVTVGAAHALVLDDAGAGEPTLATGGSGPIGREVAPDVGRLWVGLAASPNGSTGASSASHDLRDGVVPGIGAVVERRAPRTPAAAPAAAAVAVAFDVVDLGVAPEARQPLEVAAPAPSEPDVAAASPGFDVGADEAMVHGIVCSRGHFNNPLAAYCQVCGISMVHLTHNLVPGRRPTLGFVVFDTGSTFALDRSYLLGRQPTPGDLEPLVVDDAEHTVSRDHARLRLDGWDVVLEDLGSTNGTFIWRPLQGAWEQVQPGGGAIVEPGTTCAVGRRTFVYETVARSV